MTLKKIMQIEGVRLVYFIGLSKSKINLNTKPYAITVTGRNISLTLKVNGNTKKFTLDLGKFHIDIKLPVLLTILIMKISVVSVVITIWKYCALTILMMMVIYKGKKYSMA